MKKLSILSLLFVLTFSFAAFGQNFSSDWQKVPTDFEGDDFNAVYHALLSSPVLKEKSEFETTADYQKRISETSKIILGGNKSIANDFIFVYRPKSDSYEMREASQYDADKQVLNVNIKMHPVSATNPFNNSKTKNYFAVRSKDIAFDAESEYQASNAYGAVRTVTKNGGTNYSIAFNNYDDFKELKKRVYPAVINVPISLSSDKAMAVKNNLAFLYFGKLVSPFYTINTLNVKPTISRPKETHLRDLILTADVSEVWIFNNLTGEILAKIKPKSNAKK